MPRRSNGLQSFERSRRAHRRRALVIALCLAILCECGCSRAFWRKQAAQDVIDIQSEHITDPRWTLPRLDRTPDTSSRFFDPYDPDHEPLPPDDPTAHSYMHCADGWSGFKGWHRFGNSLGVENPQWYVQLGIDPNDIDPSINQYIGDPEKTVRVTLPQAIELSLINNREYQSRIEDLFLAALAVSFERFQFGVRYLGIGRREPGADAVIAGGPSRRDSLALGSRFGISQLLPWGGQWAVEFANSTLWLFSGGNQTSTASTLSFQLVQPLFFGAGRQVVMEGLTQSERNMIYETRNLARFRQTFFADVTGADSTSYLALMALRQNILNLQANVKRLEDQMEDIQYYVANHPPEASVLLPRTSVPRAAVLSIRDNQITPLRFSAPPPATIESLTADTRRTDPQEMSWSGLMNGDQEQHIRELSTDPAFRIAAENLIQSVRAQIPLLDMMQLQSALADSLNRLRNLELGYADSLDSYKNRLGIPTDFPIVLNDAWINAFRLIAGELMQAEDQLGNAQKARRLIKDVDPSKIDMLHHLKQLEAIREYLATEGARVVQDDLNKLPESLQEASRQSTAREDKFIAGYNLDRDYDLFAKSKRELEDIQRTLADAELRLKELPDTPPLAGADPRTSKTAEEILKLLDILRTRLLELTRQMQVIQIGLRLERVAGRTVSLSLEEATRTALENRFELMNARGNVMDARRRVEISANRLLGVVDFVAAADVRTVSPTNPFEFHADAATFRGGLSFTAPLDQIAERNAYSATLISYQRARREYMRTEDVIKQEVRRSWRQVQVTRRNLDTWRHAVRIAANELEASSFSNPRANAAIPAALAGSGLRGQVITQALESVLLTQNNLIQSWIDTETSRLRLYRDMGNTVIDDRGLWTDPFYQSLDVSADLYNLPDTTGTMKMPGSIDIEPAPPVPSMPLDPPIDPPAITPVPLEPPALPLPAPAN